MNYFEVIENEITSLGFEIINKDFEKPWGGFLVIKDSQAQDFVNQFFDDLKIDSQKIHGKLSPKILILNSNSKLSWQYHNRRTEIWKVYRGRIGFHKSMDDNQKSMLILNEKDQVQIKQGERHRLVGLDNYSVICEIWQHTDSNNPSDENDIVRLSDEYGR